MLALVARGRSNRAIAATLFLSPGTVRKHLEHLYGGSARILNLRHRERSVSATAG